MIMALTRWCEDLACLGVELSHAELVSLSEHVSKIAELTKRIKQGSNNRPQRSDNWFRTTFALDSVRSPDLYFNFSLGTYRAEIRKSGKGYAVYMCNWSLYPADTDFKFNFGRLSGVRAVSVAFASGWYVYGSALILDDSVRLFTFLVKEFLRCTFEPDCLDVKGFYHVY